MLYYNFTIIITAILIANHSLSLVSCTYKCCNGDVIMSLVYIIIYASLYVFYLRIELDAYEAEYILRAI